MSIKYKGMITEYVPGYNQVVKNTAGRINCQPVFIPLSFSSSSQVSNMLNLLGVVRLVYFVIMLIRKREFIIP